MVDMTAKALEVGKHQRVQMEDLIYLVQNEPRKYARVHDLFSMNEELKRARKAFDEDIRHRISLFHERARLKA